MSADVAASLSVLAMVVVVSEVTRRLLIGARADTGLAAYLGELVSTFQLCCCTHELKLLSDAGGIEPQLALTLTYLAAVIHGLTFRGAIGNPSGVLVHAYHARFPAGCALRRIACQFGAAGAARGAVRLVWGIGLSELHVRHRLLGFHCSSPVRAPLTKAAGVELVCAFAVQTVITCTQRLEEKFRVHAVAAAITTMVYAGGSVTGAVLNPAVAFSTQFLCTGPSFLENCLIYWLSPVLGMLSSVLLSDKVSAVLWRTSSSPRLPLSSKKAA
uniref:Aquaporin n=1 Tax=Oryzias sinensis TaxID=183150 RepID=A0A8C8DU57_9TELE